MCGKVEEGKYFFTILDSILDVEYVDQLLIVLRYEKI